MSIEQRKKQSIAAGTREHRKAPRGDSWAEVRWCLLGGCACAARWCVCGVMESNAAAIVICCCNSALHRSKHKECSWRGSARARTARPGVDRGVEQMAHRPMSCVRGRRPLWRSRQAVWMFVWRVDAFSIVRQSKEVCRLKS